MRRNRVLYLLLLFLALVFVYFYGGKVPYMLFYVALILPVISIAYTAIVYVKFRYVQTIDKSTVYKGETIKFVFNVINNGVFLYPYMRLKLYGLDSAFNRNFEVRSFSLMPLNDKKHVFNLECKYRGKYEISIKSVEIEDFLGIVTFSYKPKKTFSITVLPRIIHLESFMLKTNSMTEESSALSNRLEDMYNISEVRKYQYGDNLKNIHWKLSAKLNDIMVKTYQSTARTSVTIFLDLKKSSRPGEKCIIAEDMVIETAIAVINYCLINWTTINIVYCDSKDIMNFEGKNPSEFEEIYSILADVPFNSSMEVGDIIDEYINKSMMKSNLIMITQNINEKVYDSIQRTKLFGYEASVVCVSPENKAESKKDRSKDILSGLIELGATTYMIHIDDDIKEVLGN